VYVCVREFLCVLCVHLCMFVLVSKYVVDTHTHTHTRTRTYTLSHPTHTHAHVPGNVTRIDTRLCALRPPYMAPQPPTHHTSCTSRCCSESQPSRPCMALPSHSTPAMTLAKAPMAKARCASCSRFALRVHHALTDTKPACYVTRTVCVVVCVCVFVPVYG